MEHIGKLILPEGHSDISEEGVVKFVHVKYPEWLLILESRVPYRDAQGNARGTQNPDTALSVRFRNRTFDTNSKRIIESIRSLREYRGKRSPAWINSVVDDNKVTGCVEVDKVEEMMVLRKAEIERRVREEIRQQMEQPKQAPVVEQELPDDSEFVVDMRDSVPPEAKVVTPDQIENLCQNCGSVGTGRFCSMCGMPYAGETPIVSNQPEKAKRTWTCKYCGEVFGSGFEAGAHKKLCPVRKQVEVDLPGTGPEMAQGGASTTSVGMRNPMSPPDQGLL